MAAADTKPAAPHTVTADARHSDTTGDKPRILASIVWLEVSLKLSSGFEAQGKLFDHRIRKNFSRNAFHFNLRPGRIARQRIIKRQLKVFPLADICNAFRSHAPQRTRYRLALCIEHGSLQRDINMRFHQILIID
jgi:hypothetical protein